MTTCRRAIALFVLLLMVASACSGDDDVDAGSDDGGTTTVSADDADDADDSDDDGHADDDPGEPMELFASDTGVTAETIKLGGIFPDTSLIGREPGDIEAKFQVAVDAVNDAGGINGRLIELVFDLYTPVGDVEVERVCTEHVEDVEVFATVGLFLRESVLCWTELGDTIAVNSFPNTDEMIERSTVPLFSVDALSSRLVETKVDTLLEAGHLAAGMKVGVHGVIGDEALHDAYIDALEARDIDVVSKTIRTTQGDLELAKAELDLIGERWRADGVEVMLGSSPESAMDMAGPYNTYGFEYPMLLPEDTHVPPSLMQEFTGGDLTPLEYAVSLISGASDVELYEQGVAGVPECVDRFAAASGEEVAISAEVGAADNLPPTIMACQVVDIFAQVAEAAGVDLTTESFGAAAEALGPIDVTGVVEASLGPGKFDVTDTPPVIATYDTESQTFVAV